MGNLFLPHQATDCLHMFDDFGVRLKHLHSGEVLDIFDKLSEEDFAKPTPEGTPNFLADIGSVFETAVWHEGLHSGQLSVTRRSLGFDPAYR